MEPKNKENWLLLTSKGYPDMLTLSFLNELLEKLHSNIEIYYLGDYDIYGADIMLNYSIGINVN